MIRISEGRRSEEQDIGGWEQTINKRVNVQPFDELM